MTINEALSFIKIIRQRKAELENLRSQVSTKKTETYWGERDNSKKDTLIEPQFNVKDVDRKIVELSNAIYKIDAAIKQANATVSLGIEIDRDALLAPLS
jgi:hypothetical protein